MSDSVLDEQELDRLRKELAAFVLDEVSRTLVSDTGFRESTETVIATRIGEILDRQLTVRFQETDLAAPLSEAPGYEGQTGMDTDSTSLQSKTAFSSYIWLTIGVIVGALAVSLAWYLATRHVERTCPVTQTPAAVASPLSKAPATPPTGNGQ